MNMIEAIKEAQSLPNVWFRPVSWRNTGAAYTIGRGGRVEFVPTARGGVPARFPDVNVCLGEWEVIDPGFVHSEQPNNQER